MAMKERGVRSLEHVIVLLFSRITGHGEPVVPVFALQNTLATDCYLGSSLESVTYVVLLRAGIPVDTTA